MNVVHTMAPTVALVKRIYNRTRIISHLALLVLVVIGSLGSGSQVQARTLAQVKTCEFGDRSDVILDRWRELGGPASPLGCPLTADAEVGWERADAQLHRFENGEGVLSPWTGGGSVLFVWRDPEGIRLQWKTTDPFNYDFWQVNWGSGDDEIHDQPRSEGTFLFTGSWYQDYTFTVQGCDGTNLIGPHLGTTQCRQGWMHRVRMPKRIPGLHVEAVVGNDVKVLYDGDTALRDVLDPAWGAYRATAKRKLADILQATPEIHDFTAEMDDEGEARAWTALKDGALVLEYHVPTHIDAHANTPAWVPGIVPNPEFRIDFDMVMVLKIPVANPPQSFMVTAANVEVRNPQIDSANLTGDLIATFIPSILRDVKDQVAQSKFDATNDVNTSLTPLTNTLLNVPPGLLYVDAFVDPQGKIWLRFGPGKIDPSSPIPFCGVSSDQVLSNPAICANALPFTDLDTIGTPTTDGALISPAEAKLLPINTNGKGIALTEYSFDNTAWQPYNAPVRLPVGTPTLYYRSRDTNGTTEAAKQHTFVVIPGMPKLTQFNPPTTLVGNADTTVIVAGDEFVPTSQIVWNGQALPTSFVDSQHLSVIIPSAYLIRSSTAEVHVVTPPPGGGTSESRPFVIISTTPAVRLEFFRQPSDSSIGAPLTPTLLVRALDAAGNVATNFNGPVTVALRAGSGTAGAQLDGTVIVNAVNGVATFSDLTIDRPGEHYLLVARSGNLGQPDSAPFDVHATSAYVGMALRVPPDQNTANQFVATLTVQNHTSTDVPAGTGVRWLLQGLSFDTSDRNANTLTGATLTNLSIPQLSTRLDTALAPGATMTMTIHLALKQPLDSAKLSVKAFMEGKVGGQNRGFSSNMIGRTTIDGATQPLRVTAFGGMLAGAQARFTFDSNVFANHEPIVITTTLPDSFQSLPLYASDTGEIKLTTYRGLAPGQYVVRVVGVWSGVTGEAKLNLEATNATMMSKSMSTTSQSQRTQDVEPAQYSIFLPLAQR